MPDDKVNINWNYSGEADFLLGTGATNAEQVLGWVASLVGASLYGYLYLTHALNWAWWQYILAGFLAFDVIGGIVANSLNSCKRFYHTAVKPDEPQYTAFFKNHFAFSALHVHTLLIAILFGAPGYFYGIFWYAFLLAGTIIIISTPLYLKRPVAFLAISLALLLNIYVISPVQGFEWFAPALMIKILYGHLVKEEPYRPATEKSIL
ncbi:MAG: hypothetical protein NT121_03595 [Chloroflexi bacterium]|nr:hypothetical protein [Chloroflexota bacterium]